MRRPRPDRAPPRTRAPRGTRCRRVGAALAAALSGLCALMALGCGDGAATPRELVLARVGTPERTARTHPPQHAVVTKRLRRARQAVPASADGFEIEVPSGARRLRLSMAAAPGDAPSAFHIEIRPGSDSPWRDLARPEIGPGRSWQDHEWPLPALTSGARLRLSATTLAGDEPPLWGSIQLLGPDATPPPANLILISLDTLGAAHVGALSGRSDLTPRLDAFLSEAAVLRHAFAQYGNTLVSHASLFSGLYPRHHGVYTEQMPGPLDSSLVRRLAAAGLHTVAFTEGAFVSAAFGFGVGFDSYDENALGIEAQIAGGAEKTFARAADFVENARGERFALFVHTYEVHAPYLPRNQQAIEVANRRTPGDIRVFPGEFQALAMRRHNRGQQLLPPRDLARFEALHEGEVHYLDALLGELLDRIAASGVADDTLVVVTADHGDQFGEAGKVGHGNSLHNRVLHVPLALRWPGVVAPRSLDAPVELVDVMPTVLDLLGLSVPPEVDGVSLAPALRDPAGPLPERPAFSEQRSSRSDCARLGLGGSCRLDRLAVQGPRFKLVVSTRPPWRRLFDLEADPLERRDVAAEYPEELARLSALAEAYRHDTAAGRADSGGARPLDAQTREQLRALGYLDEAAAPPPHD